MIPIATSGSHPQFYTVRHGDTLVTVADRFSVSVEDLRKWNHLKSNHVNRGMVLRIYSLGGASEARPTRCCGCGAASRAPGANLVVHGDGTRERQVRGPASAQDEPQLGTVRVRRFECQRAARA